MTKPLVRVRAAEPLDDGFSVRMRFTNGEEKVVDLEPYLRGEVFEAIRRDAQLFRALRVDDELGTIVWPNGADIDPDVLYLGLDPAWRTAGRTGESTLPYESEP